jgi:hypothetical protein
MFESKIADEAVKFPDCMEFIDLYARFCKDVKDPRADRVRISRFEVRLDNAWRALSEDKRNIIVDALLIKKMLPEEVKRVIQEFKAKVVSLI